MPLQIPRLVLAGTHTGVGKTTFTLGVMRALQRRGLRVQGFKAGPDFIDPSHHTRAAGRVSRNLDTWMCSDRAVRELFTRAAGGADVAIVEGMMGLFDGAGALDERGSTAHLAKLLDAPVVLVVDAWALARSAGALVLGYQSFDPDVSVAGILLNRVAGPGHLGFVAPAIEQHTRIPVLGWLPQDAELAIAEQHLGLVTADAWQASEAWYDRVADRVVAGVDLDRLLALARAAPALGAPEPAIFAASGGRRDRAARIGIARDAAFSFYYEDNLDLLRQAGGEIIPFSPLHQGRLPEVELLYFGGGFPELFAAPLAENQPMLTAVRTFVAAKKPVYAECGGLMYLGERITTFDGEAFAMTGILPLSTSMTDRKLTLGYVEVTAKEATVLGPAGTGFRGHEFHYSKLVPTGPIRHAYRRKRGNTGAPMPPDGFVQHNLLASYTHAHFASNPQLATNLVAAAAATGQRQT